MNAFLSYALTFFAGVHLHRAVTERDPWLLVLCIVSLAAAYINAKLNREDRP